MNRFVIELPEEYDCYTVDVSYPIETGLTREELLDELSLFYEEATKDRAEEEERRFYTKHVLDLGGIGVMVDDHQVTFDKWMPGEIIRVFMAPKIMTVEEWFATCGHG